VFFRIAFHSEMYLEFDGLAVIVRIGTAAGYIL